MCIIGTAGTSGIAGTSIYIRNISENTNHGNEKQYGSTIVCLWHI